MISDMTWKRERGVSDDGERLLIALSRQLCAPTARGLAGRLNLDLRRTAVILSWLRVPAEMVVRVVGENALPSDCEHTLTPKGVAYVAALHDAARWPGMWV